MTDTPINHFYAISEGDMDWAAVVNGYWQNLEQAFVSGGKYISQLNVDNGVLFVDSISDRVGIRTSAPNAILDVRGDAIFNEDATDSDFRIEGTSEANLFFVDAGNNRIGIGTSTPAGKLDLRGTGDANLLFVDAVNNRVGIGTNVPTAPLHVTSAGSGYMTFENQSWGGGGSPALNISTGSGSGNNAGAYMNFIGKLEAWINVIATNNTYGQRWMRFGNLSNFFSIQLLNDLGNEILSTPFTFSNVAPTYSFYMTGSGNIGLGTYSPNAKLDVRGSAIFNEDSGDHDFRIEGENDLNLFFTDASTDRVGISTATPNAKLDVVGASRFGDSSTNYVNIGSTGNLSFQGSAGFYPRRIIQDAQPTLSTGELAIWHDSDDSKVYLLYNDTSKGHVKVELA